MPVQKSASPADNLRAELARQQRRQGELAEVWGLSEMAVSRRLSGAVEITVSQLISAAAWLKLDVAALLPSSAVVAERGERVS